VEFLSACLKRNVHVNAYIPLDEKLMPGMEPKKGPFKTMYMLHGYTGGSCELLTGRYNELSNLYNIAIIMPEGENHFYVDAKARNDLYGEFIGRELVNFTLNVFPLSRKRDDTIIAGISMGGYGAIRNGLKYSDVFGHVIGISLANIIYELADSKGEPNHVGATRGFYESVFGDLDAAIESDLNTSWLAEKMVQEGKTFPNIYFCCGWNDSLVHTNRDFHNALTRLGVEHVFEEGPGSHEPLFFDPHLIAGLERLRLDKQPEMPNPFWIEKDDKDTPY
jgi:S-formylglutathione hydrolase FrmB